MVYTQSQHINTKRKTTNEPIKFDRNTLAQPTCSYKLKKKKTKFLLRETPIGSSQDYKVQNN